MARLGRAHFRRYWRLFVVVAYALVGALMWQQTLVEVFEHDDSAEECPEDEGPCDDCGDTCHCCFACAHQATPALPAPVVELPRALLALLEGPSPLVWLAPPSADVGPPSKVPKHLA